MCSLFIWPSHLVSACKRFFSQWISSLPLSSFLLPLILFPHCSSHSSHKPQGHSCSSSVSPPWPSPCSTGEQLFHTHTYTHQPAKCNASGEACSRGSRFTLWLHHSYHTHRRAHTHTDAHTFVFWHECESQHSALGPQDISYRSYGKNVCTHSTHTDRFRLYTHTLSQDTHTHTHEHNDPDRHHNPPSLSQQDPHWKAYSSLLFLRVGTTVTFDPGFLTPPS